MLHMQLENRESITRNDNSERSNDDTDRERSDESAYTPTAPRQDGEIPNAVSHSFTSAIKPPSSATSAIGSLSSVAAAPP